MEAIISNLVSQFEKGALNRRQLVRGLAMLAATGTAARAAQNDIDFKTADIDHVSIQVTDLQRSVDFYKKMVSSDWREANLHMPDGTGLRQRLSDGQ